MLSEEEKDKLDKIFYGGENYLFGINKFMKELRRLHFQQKINIPQNKIKYYYNNQEVVQRFKPKEKIKRIKISEGSRPFEKMYSDTMFLTDANISLLNFLDYFSRFCFIFIFRNSKQINSKNSAKCLQKVIDYARDRNYEIGKIITDQGSEFYGEFSKMCEKNNIKQEYSRTGDKYKTSPIESFNRTVRSMFEKYKIVNKVNASNIFNVMKQINKKYNNSYHSVLKATPQEIIDGKEKNNNEDSKNTYEKYDGLNKGDDVRIYIKNDMDVFNKLTPLWSKEIYKIESKRNGYYKLNNNKLYRNNELQKVNINNIMNKYN